MTNTTATTAMRMPAARANDQRALEAAATTRLLVAERILDYSGHVSVRVPGAPAFVIQTGSHSRAEVGPDAMLVVDFDGRVIEGDGQPPSEIPIHIEIFKARPDVQAVLHAHMELAIAFTMMEGVTLQPMRARASRWKSGIPTDPDPSHIKTSAQGQALAKTLGAHHAVLMRAHGLTLVAESPQALFVDAVHFKENATAQMQALQAGAKPLPLTDAEIAQIEAMEMRDWHIHKLWNYYVRKGVKEGVLPAEWAEPLLPSRAMLTRGPEHDAKASRRAP
ncbi:MAG: class II aldolase/adducin family protein [Hyphomicrobiales bacterium]|nr:class II aldolase/adducin family protein [Hyphomicrobiales bacterium]